MATGLPANATGIGLSPDTAATGRLPEQPGTLRLWSGADDGRGLRDRGRFDQRDILIPGVPDDGNLVTTVS